MKLSGYFLQGVSDGRRSILGITSFILGILSLTGVCVSLVPFLNLLNCLNLPLALVGVTLGFVDMVRYKPEGQGRAAGILGFILCLLALLIGGGRFLISLFTTAGFF